MPSLSQTLLKYDLGQLKIIGELWGLELKSRETDAAAEELSTSILNLEPVRDTVDVLSAEARAALNSLVQAGGKMEWASFARSFGEIREMGPGKRDRQSPHLKPSSAAEILFYRGLLARAFFESGGGAREFAYIPDDLLPLLDHGESQGNLEIFGRPATPSERSFELPASDRILDDATTLLAALRVGMKTESLPAQLRERGAALQELLSAAKLIKNKIPQTAAVKSFFESTRPEALDMLYKAWLDSQTFDELRLIPGILCEGEWTNSPRGTRHILLGFLRALPTDKWWSLPAFLRDLKTRHPDFQRPAGDYDSWFIKRASDGQYLRGFSHWDEVDGAVARTIIQMLHSLGRVDLASAGESGAITSFRFSTFVEKKKDIEKIVISSNGKITAPRLFPRAIRYQLARFCDWEDDSGQGAVSGSEKRTETRPDEYRYQVTAQSLKRADEQGLKAGQLLSLLVKHTNGNVPPALVKALKRWEANGAEARVESLAVLRVSRAEVIAELRKSKAGKFLDELLSPTAVVVKEAAIHKVIAALAELGLLAEVE